MYGKCVGNGYIPELDKCPEEVGEEEGVEEVVADEEDEEEKREMRAHVWVQWVGSFTRLTCTIENEKKLVKR